MKTEKQIAAAAAAFAGRWKGRGYERGESQLFWADLLSNVYGVEDLSSFIRYEEQVSSNGGLHQLHRRPHPIDEGAD